jgi:putative phosphoribosyl transferase
MKHGVDMERLLHPQSMANRSAPGLLQTQPHALGLVLLPPRPMPWFGSAQQPRLLQALHSRQLSTLTLAARRTPGVALRWLSSQPDLARLPLGLWASGAAALQALSLAAQNPARVGALVTINAELDGDLHELSAVNAATMLLVLGQDKAQLALQQQAMKALHCDKRLEWIPQPAQPADEGAVDAVVQIAGAWLQRHLAGRRML